MGEDNLEAKLGRRSERRSADLMTGPVLPELSWFGDITSSELPGEQAK